MAYQKITRGHQARGHQTIAPAPAAQLTVIPAAFLAGITVTEVTMCLFGAKGASGASLDISGTIGTSGVDAKAGTFDPRNGQQRLTAESAIAWVEAQGLTPYSRDETVSSFGEPYVVIKLSKVAGATLKALLA